MGNWTRLRRQSHAPRELDGTETIYAAADGTLMHMDPEGSETELGTGGGGGGDVPFVGADPPDSPTDGMLWWDTDDDTDTGGGSQTLEIVRVPLAFDTPDLVLTGITLATLAVGDVLVGTSYDSVPNTGWMSKTTVWDGTTPTLWITTRAQIASTYIASADLTAGGDEDYFGDGSLLQVITDGQPGLPSAPMYAAEETELVAFVDDGQGPGGSGVDPESSQGAAELVLWILRAA